MTQLISRKEACRIVFGHVGANYLKHLDGLAKPVATKSYKSPKKKPYTLAFYTEADIAAARQSWEAKVAAKQVEPPRKYNKRTGKPADPLQHDALQQLLAEQQRTNALLEQLVEKWK